MKKLKHQLILLIFLLIVFPNKVTMQEKLKQTLQKKVFTRVFHTKEELTQDAKIMLDKLKTKKNENLRAFAERKAREWKTNYPQVLERARARGLKIKGSTPDGGSFELMGFKPDGRPIYYATDNAYAARTSSVDAVQPGGSLGLVLTGSGITLGEWDGDAVLTTHQEFNNTGTARVTQSDGETTLSSHATHVAGIIMAGGVVSRARGMSYQGALKSYDWTSDVSEMAFAALDGLKASNHSYGTIAGWYWDSDLGAWKWYGPDTQNDEEDDDFGRYDDQSRDWDEMTYNAPYYLIVIASGNDNGDGPGDGGVGLTKSSGGVTSFSHPDDGATGGNGFDCISTKGNGKNVITIGRVDAIIGGFSQASDVVLASSSSTGPCDDGRIKPDIVAQGTGLYSSDYNANDDYATKSGTSMSSPAVTGSIGLLLEHQRNLHGEDSPLLSATVKGILIHTADEAGSNNGPDYKFGWGLMNVKNAVDLMTDDNAGSGLHIKEAVLYDGQTLEYTVVVPSGASELQATLCWTDVQHAEITGIDITTAAIVNELDLCVIGPSPATTTYYPWSLDGANPSNAATATVENNVDNVEQVTMSSPTAGTYTVRVDHDGSLTNGLQQFSLIVTGNSSTSTSTTATTTQNTNNVNQGTTQQQIIGMEITNLDNNDLSATSLSLNTTGTTSTGDISNAKLFYTGTSSTFAAYDQFGSTETSPSGSFTITGSQQLALGKNYFWLSYDISASATVTNVVDAQCTSVTVGGSALTPSTTNPTGSRSITNLTMGTGKTYSTIAAAITAASSGQIIDVFGTITEIINITGTKNLTIQGQGATSTIVQAHASVGSASDRVFEINGTSIEITIKDMTIKHGNVAGDGGGIWNGNSLTLQNCAIVDNRTTGSDDDGGGIYTKGTTTIQNCTISGNQANTSDGSSGGGGIYISNTNQPTVTITNSTISGNSTGSYGGGIDLRGGSGYNTTLSLTNVTITNNVSPNNGGGILRWGIMNLKNTIIAGNTAPSGPDVFANSGGTTNSSGYNIIGNSSSSGFSSGSPNSNNDYVGVDPLLNGLADNGGATQTHSLQSSSPAVNNGTDSGSDVPLTDQRYESREGTSDIGAYEYQTTASAPTATTRSAYDIEQTTATANATVNANNASTTVVIEYGLTAAYGSQVNATPNTISGTEDVNLIGFISGLDANTLYHFRVKATNSSGTTNGSDATFTTLANTTPVGGSGNALDFDGVDDRIDISDNESLDMDSGTLTIEAWIKPHYDVLSGTYEIIIEKVPDCYILCMTDNGKARMYVRNSSGTAYRATSDETLTADKWVHLAGVVSMSSSYVKLYIDGILVVTNSSVTGSAIYTSSSDLRIGYDASNDSPFKGAIDQVRLWNDVRTQTEIIDNMYKPLEGSESNLMGYWHFDESASSATAYDQTIYENNGTLTNMDAANDWIASTTWQDRTMGSGTTLVVNGGYDPDGDSVTLTTSSGPSHGSLEYNNSAKTVTYTPNSGSNSSDAFTYQISDGSANDTYTVNVTSGYLDVSGSGNALDFDGSNDYVRIPASAATNFGSSIDFSLELWVKTSGWTGDPGIISNKHWGSGANNGFILAGNSSGGKWKLNIGDGSSNRIDIDGGVINDGNWHHLAVTVDRDGNAITYQDGVQVNTTSMAAIGGIDSGHPVCIAQTGQENYTYYFTGQVDKICIWNDIRTPAEIQENMCKILTGSEANLIGYYRSDHAWGAYLHDYSSTYNHGTLKNMTNDDWVTSGAPIGDASTSNFSSPTSVSLSHTNGDQMTINNIGGSPNGIVVYRIDEAPMVTTTPAGWSSFYSNRYWGVYVVGGTTPTYDVMYNHNGYPDITYEDELGLAKRDDNADASWASTIPTLDNDANTIALSGESGTEYIMGKNSLTDVESVSSTATYNFNEAGEDGNGYDIDMAYTALSGSGEVTVRQVNYPPADAPCINVCNVFWDITSPAGITSFSSDLTFHYTDSDASGYTESDAYFGIAKYNSSTNTWQWLGGTVNAANNTVTVSGVTSFSKFALYRRIFGDITNDGYVDAADLQELGDVWHQTNSGEFTSGTDARFFNFNKNTDSDNQIIDAADLQVFGDCWHNGVEPPMLMLMKDKPQDKDDVKANKKQSNANEEGKLK
jgi:hypothetical protein